MDTYDAIVSKLDVREFAAKHVPGEIKRKILEAARLTGSSMNSQHWRFLLIQDRPNLKRLAQDSTTGGWVENADFAIVIMTNPKVPGSVIDAGRVLQDMQLTAWNFGVVSRLFTGIKEDNLRSDFGVPSELKPTAVLGFGYPKQKILGKKKDRKALEELVFSERYGNPLDLKQLAP
jgi:nitroreductase